MGDEAFSASDVVSTENVRIVKVRARIELIEGKNTVAGLWQARLKGSRWGPVKSSVGKNGVHSEYLTAALPRLERLMKEAPAPHVGVARQLVYMATDPQLLYRMWIGWSPHC